MTPPFAPDRFPHLFDAAPLGIAILDADGRVVAANPALLSLGGCTLEDVRGRSPADFAAPEDRPTLAARLAGDPPAGACRFALRRADGSELPCSLTASAVAIDGRRVVVVFVQDVQRTGPGGTGAATPGGPGPAGPEDGGHRDPRRRHRARFQQPAHGHPGQHLALAARQGPGAPRRALPPEHRKNRGPRLRAHPPDPGLRPRREVRGQDRRPEPAGPGVRRSLRPIEAGPPHPPAARGGPLDGGGRRGADPAGHPQPAGQRRPGHARRGRARARERQRRGRPPRPRKAAGRRTGPLRPRHRHRHGRRHPQRDPGTHLRTLLHHRREGEAHRPGVVLDLRDREGARRVHDRAQRARTGFDLQHLPAGRGPRRRAPHGARRAGRRQPDHPAGRGRGARPGHRPPDARTARAPGGRGTQRRRGPGHLRARPRRRST